MKITVLEPDEQIDAVNVSTAKQHINKLSVLKGGVWAPIVFDALDYVGCNGVRSHKAIVTDDYNDDGYTVDRCTFFATAASPTLLSDTPDGATVLTSDDDVAVVYKATTSQFKDSLSVLKRSEWAPISYDSLDYISCDGAKSHRAVVTDDSTDDGYAVEKCTAYAVSTTPTKMGEAADTASVLTSDDDIRVTYRSSISQFKGTLSVSQRGEWVPLSYDVLDYLGCDGTKSHRAVVTDGDDIGYQFNVAEQVCYTDKYVYHDRDTVELRELPHWFGEGFYEAYVHEAALINSDTESLGSRSKQVSRVGLSYALAAETLEPDD